MSGLCWLVMPHDPLSRIQTLLAEREPRYAALADYQLDTSACANADEAAALVLNLLTPHTTP